MKITKKILSEICDELCVVPPEKGGIIGSEDGVVCVSCLDDGVVQVERYAYVPDIEKLNGVIDQWAEKGIRFAGMFHSHPYPQTGLSVADKEYILKIMEAMPETVSELHFPIVVPGVGMIGYLAKRRGGETIIAPEDINIVKE